MTRTYITPQFFQHCTYSKSPCFFLWTYLSLQLYCLGVMQLFCCARSVFTTFLYVISCVVCYHTAKIKWKKKSPSSKIRMVLTRINVHHKKNTHTHNIHCISFTPARLNKCRMWQRRVQKGVLIYSTTPHYIPFKRAWRGAQLSIVHFIPESPEPTLPLWVYLNTVLSWQRERVWRGGKVSRVIGRSILLTSWLIELCAEGSPIMQCLLHKIICSTRVTREKKTLWSAACTPWQAWLWL